MNTMSIQIKTPARKYELKARAESERQTRARIVQATMELHKEVGPAKTTVAEIARRAGVTRLTVYNHFSGESALYSACQTRWMQLHPLPDFSAALALADPSDRVRTVLRGFYAWYRKTAPMAEKIQCDRGAVPALDALMARTADARLTQLSDSLAAGFGRGGRRASRPLIRLALDFWTWRRLGAEGLSDKMAADLMTNATEATTMSRKISLSQKRSSRAREKVV